VRATRLCSVRASGSERALPLLFLIFEEAKVREPGLKERRGRGRFFDYAGTRTQVPPCGLI
jgi:hypothetical protein